MSHAQQADQAPLEGTGKEGQRGSMSRCARWMGREGGATAYPAGRATAQFNQPSSAVCALTFWLQRQCILTKAAHPQPTALPFTSSVSNSPRAAQ